MTSGGWIAFVRDLYTDTIEMDYIAAGCARRKAWPFAGSDNSGDSAGSLDNLSCTIELKDINGEACWHHILQYLPESPSNGTEDLFLRGIADIPQRR